MNFFQVTVPVAEIILDNRTAGVTFGGSWGTASRFPGFHGPDYRHDNKTGKGSKTVMFQPCWRWPGRTTSTCNGRQNVPVDVVVRLGGTSTCS